MIETPVHVVLAADNNFAMPMAVTIQSILDNSSTHTHYFIHILDGGIAKKSRLKILNSLASERCQINWIDAKQIEKKLSALALPIKSCFSIVTYFRFMLADVLPNSISRVIYLDSDVVVLNDLETLWNTELDEFALAAVIDPTIHTIGKATHLEQLELTQHDRLLPYFNAGVILINLDLWRKEKIVEQLLSIAEKHKASLLFQDQDVLNIVLRERWLPLSPIWNQTPYLFDEESAKNASYPAEQIEDARTVPAIVHFAANPKPWAKNCTHRYLNTFYSALDNTAWKGWRPTLVGRLLRKLELKTGLL